MKSLYRLTNRNLYQCQHNNKGYCIFGDQCRYQHFTETCKDRVCILKDCRFRHPKPCRNKENCKFLKRNICFYKHIKEDCKERSHAREIDNQIEGYEEEIKKLKLEVEGLKALLKSKETDLENLTKDLKKKNCLETQGLIDRNDPIKVKTRDEKIPCKKCNFSFDSKLDFNDHLKGIQHNIPVRHEVEYSFSDEEDDIDFREKCSLCKIIFTTFDSLDDHQSNYIRCEKCAVCYHNEFEFRKHENCED